MCLQRTIAPHYTVGISFSANALPEDHYTGASLLLKPETDTVTITLNIMGRKLRTPGHRITQFGVNSNVATTGHKLQGTSKDKLIVASWNYSEPNWTYIVLSRVRTLKGLFLTEKSVKLNHSPFGERWS